MNITWWGFFKAQIYDFLPLANQTVHQPRICVVVRYSDSESRWEGFVFFCCCKSGESLWSCLFIIFDHAQILRSRYQPLKFYFNGFCFCVFLNHFLSYNIVISYDPLLYGILVHVWTGIFFHRYHMSGRYYWWCDWFQCASLYLISTLPFHILCISSGPLVLMFPIFIMFSPTFIKDSTCSSNCRTSLQTRS